MKSTQKIIAQELGISEGHLSDIINGKANLGKRTAKKISKLTGRKWHMLMAYSPDGIRNILKLKKEG